MQCERLDRGWNTGSLLTHAFPVFQNPISGTLACLINKRPPNEAKSGQLSVTMASGFRALINRSRSRTQVTEKIGGLEGEGGSP